MPCPLKTLYLILGDTSEAMTKLKEDLANLTKERETLLKDKDALAKAGLHAKSWKLLLKDKNFEAFNFCLGGQNPEYF